jgi:hypothetical protein
METHAGRGLGWIWRLDEVVQPTWGSSNSMTSILIISLVLQAIAAFAVKHGVELHERHEYSTS